MSLKPTSELSPFVSRHIGPTPSEIESMLKTVGAESLEELVNKVIPQAIGTPKELNIVSGIGESQALSELREIASQNDVFRSFIGMGYHDTVVPAVIQRNIFENPGWYTQYTPYQAEIAQGRLEALLNFQTMIIDLTGMEFANASLLDEATAAAEAMQMFFRIKGSTERNKFFISKECHPQTISVVTTRAEPLGIVVEMGSPDSFQVGPEYFGALFQYPGTNGHIYDFSSKCADAKAQGCSFTVAADLMSLALLKSPGAIGADCVVGSAQRFGVPLGFGGPHAAFFATKNEYQRQVPGRVVGVSKDALGNAALRLAIQTREQHIKRDRATSNICTAQVLLAVMASMYAVYHGSRGIKLIATRIYTQCGLLASALERLGVTLLNQTFFDTLHVETGALIASEIKSRAYNKKINLREFRDGSFGISLNETTSMDDIADLVAIFSPNEQFKFDISELQPKIGIPAALSRSNDILTHRVFNQYSSETDVLRYIRKLESRDLSLTASMIPLGSCTMKLNATAEMFPVSWPEFSRIHPFAPLDQAAGYQKMCLDLERWLAEITGFSNVSLQPNAGSAGEYAGLLAIRAYHRDRGDLERNVCLIPQSAHGTNPASAVLAGMKVVVIKCDERGNIDLKDLKERSLEHREQLSALMVTYPSTHGVFEEQIKEVCEIVHTSGGQVYMDGANLNAQVGLTKPAEIGADVCHINLHKTFCIPHGGGGPGMGPIAVKPHLAPFLPGHLRNECGGEKSVGPVSAAPWGSASILPISWMYIRMMGAQGLTLASKVAILSANYISKRLAKAFPPVYVGANGYVAHECILDVRQHTKVSGVDVADIAKRLMDYGFHAPTVAWPVAGTLMVEPTESESKSELDRFCEAMLSIRDEIGEIERGEMPKDDNLLKNSPHTAEMVASNEWVHPYPRERAAFPVATLRQYKFWPSVGRIDNAYGDRNLVCSCIVDG